MRIQPDKPNRWRPWQFSIRELSLFTIVVALALGWWIDRNRLSSRMDELEEERFYLTKLDGVVREWLPKYGLRIAIETVPIEPVAIVPIDSAEHSNVAP